MQGFFPAVAFLLRLLVAFLLRLLSFSFALKFELQVGDDPRCLSIEAAAESKIDWTYVFTERDDVSGEWVLTKEDGGVHVDVTPKANEYPLLSKSYSGKGKVGLCRPENSKNLKFVYKYPMRAKQGREEQGP